tara:strand:- start:375 stop:620 length:246 start_codon:yes stop_codon:yes gene_type:complete
MTENKEPITFSFEEGGKEYNLDDLNDDQKLAYNKLMMVDQQKNELVSNANFELEKLDILRMEYQKRLKESVESESVIEVAE